MKASRIVSPSYFPVCQLAKIGEKKEEERPFIASTSSLLFTFIPPHLNVERREKKKKVKKKRGEGRSAGEITSRQKERAFIACARCADGKEK